MSNYMTNVIFVHHGMGLGGAPISLSNIITTLDRTCYEPTVLLQPSAAADLMQKAGSQVQFVQHFPIVRHTTAGGYWAVDPRTAFQWFNCVSPQSVWRRRFSDLKADIVHLNSVTLLPLCRPAREAGARVVVSVRETVLNGTWGIRRQWMADYLTRYCDAVIHISDYDRRLLNTGAPIVEVVPNWVDMNRFDRSLSGAEVRAELGMADDQKLVVTFGGATPIKGTLDFVHAASLLQSRTDCLFGIVGMPPPGASTSLPKRLVKAALGVDMREQIYSFVQKKGLTQRVRFLGLRQDIPTILAASELLVFPARRPHQARPVFEAGAMTKPVIATNFDCIYEDVEDGKNGLLVPPQNAVAMAGAIAEMLDNPARTRSMGEENYERTLRCHNQTFNAPLVEAIYERLVVKN